MDHGPGVAARGVAGVAAAARVDDAPGSRAAAPVDAANAPAAYARTSARARAADDGPSRGDACWVRQGPVSAWNHLNDREGRVSSSAPGIDAATQSAHPRS